MPKQILATTLIFLLLIIGGILSITVDKPSQPVYSIYIVWDNQIIRNDTTSYVDSNQYIFDQSNTKLIVNRIQ